MVCDEENEAHEEPMLERLSGIWNQNEEWKKGSKLCQNQKQKEVKLCQKSMTKCARKHSGLHQRSELAKSVHPDGEHTVQDQPKSRVVKAVALGIRLKEGGGNVDHH